MYKKTIFTLIFVLCILIICGETSYAQAITDGSYPETKYECNYVYSQMSKAERNVYDQMYKLCYKWLLSKEDVKQMKYGEYCIGPVDYSSVSDTEVGRLFSEIECRQKFFFIEDCMYTIDGSHEDIYFIVRSEYVSGKQRYDKFNELRQSLIEMVSPVDGKTDLEKAKYIYSIVANYLSYDINYFTNQCIDECLENKYAVCGGYANMFCSLANASGLECMVVSSDMFVNETLHGWDIVKIDDKWYHLDITWDDIDGDEKNPCTHELFLRSDVYIETLRSHKINTLLKRYYPKALSDYYSEEEYSNMLKEDLGCSEPDVSNAEVITEGIDDAITEQSGYGHHIVEEKIYDEKKDEPKTIEYTLEPQYNTDDSCAVDDYRCLLSISSLEVTRTSKKIRIKIPKKNKYADGYEYRVSNNKSYKNRGKKKVYRNLSGMNKWTLKNKKMCKRGKSLFIKVRAYRYENGKCIYGDWIEMKSYL